MTCGYHVRMHTRTYTCTPKTSVVLVLSYKPSIQEAEQESHEFEASLGHIVRLCLKK